MAKGQTRNRAVAVAVPAAVGHFPFTARVQRRRRNYSRQLTLFAAPAAPLSSSHCLAAIAIIPPTRTRAVAVAVCHCRERRVGGAVSWPFPTPEPPGPAWSPLIDCTNLT